MVLFRNSRLIALALGLFVTLNVWAPIVRAEDAASAPDASSIKEIKAYCLDFNWVGSGRRKYFAPPGTWAKEADPAAHVAWYKQLGANVIQTFCLPNNGYAWYKNGVVPEQPRLKHDFLPEVVRLGHKEGMLVFGYFCAQANGKWCDDNPDQTYGNGGHSIVFTDEYLAYLSRAIEDAVKKTGIDGFMVDWMWMPSRRATEGKWIDAEKKLYKQLMGEEFPGAEKLANHQDRAYSRKAIDRCWRAIRTAAKRANPDCIIWLTVNNLRHHHIAGSDMLKEVDWLMNEAGDMASINHAKSMIGENTRLVTCLAAWNGQDAAKVVPEALAAGVGLYGFTMPKTGGGLVPLEPIFQKQFSEMVGDERNIAMMARAYNGFSMDAVWKDGSFVEAPPPPFRIQVRAERGFQNTASAKHEKGVSEVIVTPRHPVGRVRFARVDAAWPAVITIRLQLWADRPIPDYTVLLSNGKQATRVDLSGNGSYTYGELKNPAVLRGHSWRNTATKKDNLEIIPLKNAGDPPVTVKRSRTMAEITISGAFTRTDTEEIVLEYY